MLKPTNDRLDYGNLLQPPVGYEVSEAIGTTYSLDLDALVGICIALGLSGSIDSQLMKNPVYLLEALRKTAGKVSLFCEAGQIKVPSSQNSLYMLLEKMIFQVALKKSTKMKRAPSFHPKFWLIKYENQNHDVLYRAVVLSRNLTFDHSWDVAAVLDGKPGGDNAEGSQPISDFLNYLSQYITGNDANSKSKRKSIMALSKELTSVSFELNNKTFRDFEFIPEGIRYDASNAYSIKNTRLFTDTFHEVVIISPFLSTDVIRDFNDRNTNIENPSCTLITRKAALDKIKPEHASRFKCYALKDQIVDGEDIISDTNEIPSLKQDLHAKVFLFRKYSESDLYLGSLNATHSAMNGNVEMTLRLGSTNRYLNTRILLDDLFGSSEKENPFEETELPSTPKSIDFDELDILQKKIKDLCRAKASAFVAESESKYNIHIDFENLCDVEGLKITPLFHKKFLAVEQKIDFNGLNALQLSEFYIVTASGVSESIERIIKIPTTGIPDDRDKQVVAAIINNKQSFIEYITFLLSDDYILSILESDKVKVAGPSSANAFTIPALYEKMLYTAARAPERLKEIEYIVRMIGDSDVIPEEFIDLYSTFKKAVGIK
ncbi:MAG TPA: phospholipase D family protein [Anaerovoracaceae bacterium]|nr:phospholipase D family protein [Anaerovoracaceae bacterium]